MYMSRSGFAFLFCKQKTAYEMRISDWSSDVCSSDLLAIAGDDPRDERVVLGLRYRRVARQRAEIVDPFEHDHVVGATARGSVVVEPRQQIGTETVAQHAVEIGRA